MAMKRVRIYTCDTHPNWSLETSAPEMASGLKTVCPLCREEFIVAHIGLANCRVEMRDDVSDIGTKTR